MSDASVHVMLTKLQASLVNMQTNMARAQSRDIGYEDQIGKAPINMTNANGNGDESTLVIWFADTFIDEPVATFGAALDPGTPIQPGVMPSLVAHVVRWQMDNSGPNAGTPQAASQGKWGVLPVTRPVYTGATVAVVTTGTGTIWLHYSFKGRAVPFSNWSSANGSPPS